MQLFQSIPQIVVIRIFHRIQSAEHHRRSLPVTGQRFPGRMVGIRYRVAYPGLAYRFNGSRQKTYLTGPQHIHVHRSRFKHAYFRYFVGGSGSHHLNFHAFSDRSVVDTQI